MNTYTEEELKAILEKHLKWLRDEPDGERADLRYADLSSADLRYADLDDLFFEVQRVGSRNDSTIWNATKDIVWCGCFTGKMSEFEAKIDETYSQEHLHNKEYKTVVAYFKALKEIHDNK